MRREPFFADDSLGNGSVRRDGRFWQPAGSLVAAGLYIRRLKDGRTQSLEPEMVLTRRPQRGLQAWPQLGARSGQQGAALPVSMA